MRTLNKWIRQIHRWLVMPLLLAILVVVIGSIRGGEAFQSPAWLTIIAIGSLLSLGLTGLYMFAQHYWARRRRAQ